MNWMTSSRHRALYSKRGKRKQMMHFPSHVPMDRNHQRIRINECINITSKTRSKMKTNHGILKLY